MWRNGLLIQHYSSFTSENPTKGTLPTHSGSPQTFRLLTLSKGEHVGIPQPLDTFLLEWTESSNTILLLKGKSNVPVAEICPPSLFSVTN